MTNLTEINSCDLKDISFFREIICRGSRHPKPVSISGGTISFLGLIMNYFCYKTSLALPLQSTSTNLMAYLAVWDSISVVHDGLIDMGLKSLGFHLADYFSLGCKIYYYHSWASTINAGWHVIALALDRALSIIFPIWHHGLDVHRTTRVISWSLTLLAYIAVLPNLFFFEIEQPANVCTMSSGGFHDTMLAYIGIITYLCFSFLPFFLILFANVIFIWKVHQIRKEKKIRTSNKVTIVLKSNHEEASQKFLSETDFSKVNDDEKTSMIRRAAEKVRYKLQYVDEKPEDDQHQNTPIDDSDLWLDVYCGPSTPTPYQESEPQAPKNPPSKVQVHLKMTMDPPVINSIKKKQYSPILSTINASRDENTADSSVGNKGGKAKKTSFGGDINVIVTLIVISCSYLMFSVASCSFNRISQTDMEQELSANEAAFAQLMAELMAVLNNSLNFIFYYLSGQMFRSTFKQECIVPVKNFLQRYI